MQAQESIIRKRKRIARSCEQCRLRKVRCDQEYPCGPCRRSRDRLVCGYRDRQSLKTRRIDDGDDSAAPVHGSIYGDETGRFVPDAADDRAQDGWTAVNSHGAGGGTAIGEQQAHSGHHDVTQGEAIRRLEERVRQLEDEAYEAPEHDVVNSSSGEGGLTITRTKPRLRFTRDKVKMFNESHWVHTAEKAFSFGSFDSGAEPSFGADKEEFVRGCKELRILRNSLKAAQRPIEFVGSLSTFDLRASIPPRDICDQLIDGYMRTFERLYRILHTASFTEQYDQLWHELRSQEPLLKSFLIKLVLVLAIGAPFLPTSTSDPIRHYEIRKQAQQWITVAQWWLTSEKSAQSLQGLQISCLVLIARQINGLGTSPTFSAATVLSMAMQMGLHRDARNPGNLSVLQAESMARLWATVVELYLVHCLETGSPLLLRPEDIDAPDPSNVHDNALLKGPISIDMGTGSTEYTNTPIQLLLLKSQKVRLQALRIINGGDDISYETTVDLANQLRKAGANASAFLSSYGSRTGSSQATFPSKYIDALLRKHILLLYRPFLLARRDLKDQQALSQTRKMCLESCMIMASYTDDMDLAFPSRPPDDFSRLMVYGAGYMRAGLTLDVITTLAYELTIQLQEEEEERRSTTADGVGENATPGPSTYDPARELARAARQPILRRLEHIRSQLAQTIINGSSSLKRYMLVSALLAQITTLEAGGNAKAAFHAAVRDAFRQCKEWIEAYLVRSASARGGSNGELKAGEKTTLVPEEQDLALEDFDFGDLLDPMALFTAYSFSGNGVDVGF